MSITQTVDRTPSQPDDNASPDIEASITRISRRLNNTIAELFLDEYALAMCKELGSDYFAIGRLNPYSNIMRTLRFIANGAISDNLVYSLAGTPCADTINDGLCFHPKCVADHYPYDKELRDLQIAGYAGASLQAESGEDIGVLVGMWRNPIENEEFVLRLLESFRPRVASVIETTETVARYSWAIKNIFCGVWDWDLRTGGTTFSKGLQDILGESRKGKGPYDLTQLENAIHPEDRTHHIDAIKRHLNSGVPYDMRLRLRSANGVYRWYVSRGSATRDKAGKPERMIGGFCDIHDIVVTLEKDGAVK